MAYERWIVGKTSDGRYLVHEENDGWTYLRNGPEANETAYTREELDRTYPGLYERSGKSRDQLI